MKYLGALAGIHHLLLQGVLLCILLYCFEFCDASPEAKRLYDNLLRRGDYNKLIRPVGNSSDKLVVKIGLRLTQIIDVVSMLLMLMYL